MATPTTDGMKQALRWFKEFMDNEIAEAGGNKNAIEGVAVDGTLQPVKNKIATLDLSPYAKKTDVSALYHYKGSVKRFSDLPKTGQIAGDVYNVMKAGGTDVNGDEVKAGDNVAWTGSGWDVLSGTVELDQYIKKVKGKDLSSNDFTDAYKKKLDSLTGGTDYTLPTASKSTKGGIKIGNGLGMNGDTLNVTLATNSYTMPTASATTKGGIKIGKGLSMNGETLNAVATSDYSLPTASSTTKGGVKIGNGLSMDGDTLHSDATEYTLPTASGSTKGGVKVGSGLSMDGETLKANFTGYTLPTASQTTKGGVKIGTGLSMAGDTLKVTLESGEKYNVFGGASATANGASGLVPSPKAGDNTKFLRGDGQWAVANNITVISGDVTVPPSPQEFDGALWEDVIDNEPVLKMRYGDYEFNFNYDTKNYTGTTPPPISPEDAQLYMLDTVPSTDEGTLWYNVTQSTYFPIPALCLHAGSFDYGYNYDTITYKGDNTGLYSYLPLQQAIADAMGNTWTSYRSNVRFDTVATGVKGLRNTDTASGHRYGIVHTFSNPLATFTIDFWFTWFSTGLTNTSGNYLHMLNLYGTQANGNTFGYQHASLVGGSPGGGLVLSTGGSLTFSSTTNGVILTKTEIAGHSTRRIHIAIEHEGTKTPTIYLNGQPIARQPTTQIANIREIAIQPYVEKETSTTFLRASCIDHFRIWNKVVWGEAFTPPALSSY